MTAAKENANTLEKELSWFNRVLETRISLYFEQGCETRSIYELSPPDLQQETSEYARLVKACTMGFDERIVLMLAGRSGRKRALPGSVCR